MNIPITVLPNKDGSFTVISNVLNFVTEGDTLKEALKNAHEAAQCHVEGLKKYENELDDDYYLDRIDQSLNTFVSV